MKTGCAISFSVLISILILTTGLIIFIAMRGIEQWQSPDNAPQPLKEAEFVIRDVTDENGNVSGQRGYVEITEDELNGISSNQLREFADYYVDGGSYQWVSVQTPNRTGICFPQADSSYAEYGLLTEDGRIDYLQSIVTYEAGGYVFRDARDANEAAE